MINTHYYDGKWMNELEKVLKLDNDKFQNFDLKIPNFNEIPDFLQTNLNSQKMYEKMANKDDKDNYDPLNKINAVDLLSRILRIIEQSEDPETKQTIKDCLIEQLSDTFTSGQCSQGRTTRLFQILRLLY